LEEKPKKGYSFIAGRKMNETFSPPRHLLQASGKAWPAKVLLAQYFVLSKVDNVERVKRVPSPVSHCSF